MNKTGSGKYPLISVLMTVRNTARFLPQAIESILAETYSNFEFLIYDDVSTDDSPQIIAKYAKRDNRIRMFRGKRKAISISHIRRILVNESKGAYFTIPDSDDICLPNRLQILVDEAVRNPSISIVFGKHRMVDEYCRKTLQIFGEPISPFNYFLGGFVSPGASLISKKYYDMCEGFDETICWSEDYSLYLKLLEQAPFFYINQVVYIYRRHFASWTFERPANHDSLSIIRQKAARRSIPIVRSYLTNTEKCASYPEYVALSYVMGQFVHEFLGPCVADPAVVIRVVNKFGFNHSNFLKLKHKVFLEGVGDIEQLRAIVAKQVANIESEFSTLLWKLLFKVYHTVLSIKRLGYKRI